MADVLHVQRGFAPWAPSPTAKLVKQYMYYEIPLAGIIEEHGVHYLFFCVDGAEEPLNLWLYVHLSSRQERRLDAAESAEELWEIGEMSGAAVLALATDPLGIVSLTLIDELSPASLRAAHQRVMREIDSFAQSVHDLDPIPG